jgi:hypothetical protein
MHTNRRIGILVNHVKSISYGTVGIMKKLFIVVMVISICSIFLTSTSWAFWPFPLPPWKNNEQTKINNLEKQLEVERQMKEDVQTKISDLEDQLQYERQLKDAVQTKTSDLEKQLQVEILMKENAQKDKELAQQNTAKAESSRGLWKGISAAVGLVCLLLGLVIGSKIRRVAKIQHNADGRDNNERG